VARAAGATWPPVVFHCGRPACDLTYARGAGYTRHHQMSLNGKRDDFTRADLVALGGSMGIKRDGKDVVEAVIAAMDRWDEYAREANVPGEKIASIRKQFRLR
jgi:serine/threonine-protein kinase HipA